MTEEHNCSMLKTTQLFLGKKTVANTNNVTFTVFQKVQEFPNTHYVVYSSTFNINWQLKSFLTCEGGQ